MQMQQIGLNLPQRPRQSHRAGENSSIPHGDARTEMQGNLVGAELPLKIASHVSVCHAAHRVHRKVVLGPQRLGDAERDAFGAADGEVGNHLENARPSCGRFHRTHPFADTAGRVRGIGR